MNFALLIEQRIEVTEIYFEDFSNGFIEMWRQMVNCLSFSDGKNQQNS